jgi:hypothetical protein
LVGAATNLRAGARSFAVDESVVFYRIDGEDVLIQRVIPANYALPGSFGGAQHANPTDAEARQRGDGPGRATILDVHIDTDESRRYPARPFDARRCDVGQIHHSVRARPRPVAERVEADVDAALSAADHAGGLLAELERAGGTEDAGHCGA